MGKSDKTRKGYNMRKSDKTWEKGNNMIKSENMTKVPRREKVTNDNMYEWET